MPETWEEHCEKEEMTIRQSPACVWCGEHVLEKGEDMFETVDGWVCEECWIEHMKHARRNIFEWMDEQKGGW